MATKRPAQGQTEATSAAKVMVDMFDDGNTSDSSADINTEQEQIKKEISICFDSDSPDDMSTEQAQIKQGLMSIRSDLDDMLSSAGLLSTETSLLHNTEVEYENIPNLTNTDLIGQDLNSKDKTNNIPDKHDAVKSPEKIFRKNTCNIEKEQTVLFNGKLFVITKNVDSCLLRPTQNNYPLF